MKRKDDKIINIRKYAKAEVPHQAIYDALGLSYQPRKVAKTILWGIQICIVKMAVP